MKVYKISLDDQLAITIDRMAAIEHRSPSEYIAVMLRDWAFGVARRYEPATADELAKYRARPKRISLTARERGAVFERADGKCFHCKGQLLFNELWHVDHLIPVSRGGTNAEGNLALSCVRCNLVKAAKVA